MEDHCCNTDTDGNQDLLYSMEFLLVNLLIEICEKPVILSFNNNPAGF